MQIIQQIAQQVIQQQVIQKLDLNVESACIVGGLFLLAQSGRALIAAKAALVKWWRESGADSTAGLRSSTTNLRDELAQGIEILDQIPNITHDPSTNQNVLLEAKIQSLIKDFSEDKNKLLMVNLDLQKKIDELSKPKKSLKSEIKNNNEESYEDSEINS